jgi:hypothetical protein
MTDYSKEMELGIVIGAMGLNGARSHRNYNKMVETWIDPNEKIPTLEECQDKWDELIANGLFEPLLWEDIRKQRNKLLLESDWTQLSDSPLSPEKKTEWSVYRQELRDITSQPDPNNIVWPTKPE